ncbi:MAG TPA: autotransporter domain-containing protein [Myxococcota bacterium]|nr:autotransporter domain-containing protein [Myxococcota bacterium]
MRTLRAAAARARVGWVAVAMLAGAALPVAEARAQTGGTFQVTNANDSGEGSLRQAIEDANASTATTRTITFSVPADSTIELLTPLPEIDGSVTIDGSGATNLVIDGTTAMTHILRVGQATTTLRNLALENAPLEIASGASLAFDTTTDQQFDDVITDAGKLVKQGNAMLTLRGANDYTGGTDVLAGTLRGDTTSLQGAILNNASLVFDQDVDGSYAGAISGTGSLAKTGTGEVELTGANTYSGGTTVSAGALRGNATSLQGNIAVASGAELTFEQAADATYAGSLTGQGGFIKEGAGTLMLSGANTISGPSQLTAGALRGGFANIPRDLATSAGTQLIFDQANNGSYTGAISGDGTVTKLGTGTLTLTGANSYTGVTTLSAGALRASPSSLPNTMASSILNDASLIFDLGGAETYHGSISGTGTLAKTGSGTLTLDAAHTYTGLTSISAGRLDVDGSLAGGVDVGAAGTLGGTGIIAGPVTVSGTVSPGNSIGTLGVGSIDFAPGSLFAVEVSESGTWDRLAVAGNADLAGAELQVDPGTGDYLVQVDAIILTAASISGDFASVGPEFAFLDVSHAVGANQVTLSIVRNALTLSDFADTPNRSAIAAALEAAEGAGIDPDIDTVFDSLSVLTVDQIPAALDSMTGESLSQFATTRLATAERFASSLEARIRDHQWRSARALIGARGEPRAADGLALDADSRAGRAPRALASTERALLNAGAIDGPLAETRADRGAVFRTWIDGSAIYGDVDGDMGASGFDYDVWGGSLGADLLFAERFVVGAAGGYATTDLDFSGLAANGDVDTYQGALYAGYVDPRFHLAVSGRYAHNEMDAERQIGFIAPSRTASADLDGDDFGVRFEGGLNLFALGGFVFEPIASVHYNRLTQDDVTESGALSLNLAVEDSDLDSLVSGAGLRIRGRWQISDSYWFVPELRGRWLHEFLDTDRVIEAQLVSAPAGASSFQIRGVELPRDAGSAGLAWSVISDSAWRVVAEYDAILNGELVQHAGSLALELVW